jgi:SAM-dependent methyltransferase
MSDPSHGIALAGRRIPLDPSLLQLLVSGYALSSVILTATEIGLFDELARSAATAEELATRLALHGEGARRLLVALAALGLVQREGERYSPTPLAAAALTSAGPTSQWALLRHHHRHIRPLFAHLEEALRTGKRQVSRWPFARGQHGGLYETLAGAPEELAVFLAAMDAGATGVGRAIAERVDLTDVRTLIDLGGGGGQVAIELAQALPDLTVLLVDRPETCAYAEGRVAGAGLAARVHCVPGDLRAPPPLPAGEAVLLSAIVADWGRDDARAIVEAARRLLAPGGRVLVSETLFAPDRSGPLVAAVLSLCMLLALEGDNFTPDELTTLLVDGGFARVEILRDVGGRDLALGTV